MNEIGARDFRSPQEKPTGDLADKAKAAGRDVQDAAVELATASAEALKGHASHAMEAAKDIAFSAQDRLQDKVAEKKGLGADYVNNFADTMRLAANHFDADVPMAGTYIRKAALQIENAADALREGNFNDLIQGAQKFARSQPTAFFGLALLAGFGAVRFLKSASPESDRATQTPPFQDERWVPSGPQTSSVGDRRGI